MGRESDFEDLKTKMNLIRNKGINNINLDLMYGLPNEKIEYQDGKLFINRKEVKDNYSITKTEDFKEISIGKDEYFVMGDNRYVSQDSRMIGPIKKQEIRGKTSLILFPLSRIGLVE